jgi:CRISPR-associated Csx11 family protein
MSAPRIEDLIEALRQYRPVLLAMEAIGWFHMAGKARLEFLRGQGGERSDYNEREWHKQETSPFAWDNLLGWVNDHLPQTARPKSFAEFTEKHHGNDPGLLGLLQAAHGVVSGVEKNLPGSGNYLKQLIPHIWLSSPWGYPKRNLLADPPEILSPRGWKCLVGEIKRVLRRLKTLVTQGAGDVDPWLDWRESAIGKDSFIRRAFLSTLAETRLPNNDVTLWDQSYVAAALFKSAVARALLGALLDPSFEKSFEKKRFKSTTQWYLLTVALGTDPYEAQAIKISDWTGMQDAIEEFFRRVSELVEVDLAVGSLLYKDSAVAVFSFLGELDQPSPDTPEWITGLLGWITDQVENLAKDQKLDYPPFVGLSGPTRSLVPMVREWRRAKEAVSIPIHRPWDIPESESGPSQGHVCPVCRLRPNGDPTDKGKPCPVCLERRHRRLDEWLKGHLDNNTIWFEEVADQNGRLALLTLSLDLEGWLNGERVDSLRTQAIPEWVRFNPLLDGQRNPIDPQKAYESLTDYIGKRLNAYNKSDPVLSNLQEGFKHESSWEPFFKKIVEDRAQAPSWNDLNDDQRAAWIAHQLFRKLPSPGRVYRFWREAEDFFHELLGKFRQLVARSSNPWRVQRLVLELEANGTSWTDLELYNGHWRGKPLSLLYLPNSKGFLTTSNLARLLRPEEAEKALVGQRIELWMDDSQARFSATVVAVRRPEGTLGVYHPVIPLELSPLRFRLLVPLEAASECVDLAVSLWQERFSRVWDRLPLRVGVVGFPRSVAFQGVIEGARNLEEALQGGEESWTVKDVFPEKGSVALLLQREDGRLTQRVVPTLLPDGREDVFYPYVAVEDPKVRHPRDFRHPEGQVYRHVADLRLGDSIRVAPARALTLFMESTAERFEVPSPRYLEEWSRMREVWALLQRVAPSQAALQRLRSEMARLEADWSNPEGRLAASSELWRATLKVLIAEVLEVRGGFLEDLVEAALQGTLQWAMDWHMTALKEGA